MFELILRVSRGPAGSGREAAAFDHAQYPNIPFGESLTSILCSSFIESIAIASERILCGNRTQGKEEGHRLLLLECDPWH